MKTKEEHLYLGILHSVKGEYKEAIKEYKKALEIDPNYKPAKVNLAFISYMKGVLGKDRCASNRYMRLPKKRGQKEEKR
ncbi:MAG: tetratricopeptide repeat protein [Nitrospirota bacterium]